MITHVEEAPSAACPGKVEEINPLRRVHPQSCDIACDIVDDDLPFCAIENRFSGRAQIDHSFRRCRSEVVLVRLIRALDALLVVRMCMPLRVADNGLAPVVSAAVDPGFLEMNVGSFEGLTRVATARIVEPSFLEMNIGSLEYPAGAYTEPSGGPR